MSEYTDDAEKAVAHYLKTDDLAEAVEIGFGPGPYISHFPDWCVEYEHDLSQAKSDEERQAMTETYEIQAIDILAEELHQIAYDRCPEHFNLPTQEKKEVHSSQMGLFA